MMTQRFAIGLTAVNLLVLTLLLARQPALTAPADGTLRGRIFELVDNDGRVRSSLKVEADGEVVFRLIDPAGTIRVKLGAGAGGSGLVLLDETTAVGVHLLARRQARTTTPNTTRIVLEGAGGRRVIQP